MPHPVLLLIFVLTTSASKIVLHEVHSSSWSGLRVRQFGLSRTEPIKAVLECAVLAVKHMLSDQLLVFIAGDSTERPQCIMANRNGAVCRRLTTRTQQSPCCTRVFVISLSDCWISIQRRVDNSTSFYRNWSEYAAGFGDGPHSNHWLGLQNIYSLTWPSRRALGIRMRLWNDTEYWAKYTNFFVANEANKFRLNVSGFHGSHPSLYDGMGSHDAAMFSASDADNDASSSSDCSNYFKGGWWFTNCYICYLNGLYYNLPVAMDTPRPNGIVWKYPFGSSYSLKESEMLIL